jgi:hypothetical protein
MNPWALLGIVLAVGALTGAAYVRGRHDGENAEIASRQRVEDVRVAATEAAASAVASGLARMKVTNTTIHQTLEKEVRENTVYRDCRSGPDAVRLLNSTPGVASAASAPGGEQLPAAGAAR